MSFTNEKDLISYSLGINVAGSFKQQGFDDINLEKFVEAMQDVFEKKSLKVELADAHQALNTYFQDAAKRKAEKNSAEGVAFLAKNKLNEGVTTLPSGLQYQIIIPGSGPMPKATDQVTTHYHGTLIDGTVFDSSVERGQPATFPVNGVIAGWVEALQLMSVGSKWRLFIPSNLAYGARGAGESIGPNATLIFEVELLKIN
ncbi:MAG: FKBP-type peptidyl-prolyl cis-trans isomerase [Cytophagaceae bacterium]|jgi:FKBP-type peptidyl-prolyl cis-trans isomerase FklB|nr:FKBP-type peptidyl-prolyl cis-trans isomerase [Cytophagaceae bacterium]